MRVYGKCRRNQANWKKENQSHGSGCAAAPTLASAESARSFSHSTSRSCLHLANRRKGDRTRHAGGRDPEETERETVERAKGTKGDRARSRGAGGRPRETERDRRHRMRPKESEATLHNAATRQGKVQRGRSEPSVAGMDRGGSESWARNGRAKGGEGCQGGEGGREREAKARREQPDRPTVYQSVIRAPSWV